MKSHFTIAVPSYSLLSSFARADVKEEVVKFTVDGQNIVGTLALPEGGPAPVDFMAPKLK